MTAPEERCAITELPRYMCAHCRKVELPDAAVRRLGRWFRSGFSFQCADCGGSYPVESPTRSDGDGGYLCMGCGTE